MKDTDDFFVRKSADYWKKSLIYDVDVIDFIDEGQWLFMKNIKNQYDFDGYWRFSFDVNDVDNVVQFLLILMETDMICLCKIDMLALSGSAQCYLYLDSEDIENNKVIIKSLVDCEIISRNRLGVLQNIFFNFIKNNERDSLMLSHYLDLKTGKLK